MTDSNDNDSKDLQVCYLLNNKTVSFVDFEENIINIPNLTNYDIVEMYKKATNRYNYKHSLMLENDTDIVIALNNTSKKTKKYSEAIKQSAVALYSVIGSYSKVARQLNINSRNTVKNWVMEDKETPLNKLSATIKKRYKNKLVVNADILLDNAMDQAKIDNSSTLQLATAQKIFLDSQSLITEDQQQTILEQYSQSETLENNLDASSDEILELEAMIKEMESKPDNSSDELDLPF